MPTAKMPIQEAPKYELEKVLFSWKAPTYSYRKKNRAFWVKLTAVVSLLGFIFFIAEGIMPVVLLVSVLFLFYILTAVEPEGAQYSITNRGLNISDKKNSWQLFSSYYFQVRNGVTYLCMNMHSLPGRLDLIINEKDLEKIESCVLKYIPKDETPKNRFDKASEWVSNKIS